MQPPADGAGRDETSARAAASEPVAVTGATGFVGRVLCNALVAHHSPTRALVRSREAGSRLPPEVEAVQGSLDDEASLSPLIEGVGTVIHLAGLVAARRTEDYQRVNDAGTKRLLAAVGKAARPARVLLVSSLAARNPAASPYAASKRAGEDAAVDSGLEVCVVRPPAVYGPRDRGTLPIFRQLSRGLLVAPGSAEARFSLLYVDDLARLLCRLLARPVWRGEVIEPDDGRPGGYRWADLAALAAPLVGRPVRCVQAPRPLVWCAALAAEAVAAVRGRAPMLSRGKLGELWYPDWVCRERPVDAMAGWAPRVGFVEGASCTLDWYRRHGWL